MFRVNKEWGYVGLTCFFELCWLLGFNIATEAWHWIVIVILILIDFSFLTMACKSIPTGTVYAIFAGVGAVGATFMDMFLFDTQIKMTQIFFVTLIIIGVVQLKRSDDGA